MSVDDEFSLAALLRQLGGIHPRRVRLRPAPGTATECDVLTAEAAPRKSLCELIDGTLVEKPMGYPESLIASEIIFLLKFHLRQHGIRGFVGAPDGFMRLAPGSVRIPDVSFVKGSRIDQLDPSRPIADFAPDLAVEVLSKSNTRREMERKRRDYFAAGTQIVWEVSPANRTVDVYLDPNIATQLTENDVLTGGSVLPEFSIVVREIFES